MVVKKKLTLPYKLELSSDPEFIQLVFWLVGHFKIEEIVETGSFQGLGSTLVFAQTGLPVFSIECNRDLVETSRGNLKGFPNVKILLGYSLPRKEMLEFIIQDKIYETHPELYREGGSYAPLEYIREISQGRLKQNLLLRLIDNKKKQLVLLDSCGGIGYLEFKTFMSVPHLKNKILILDDIQHVKHYRSFCELKRRKIKLHLSKSRRWLWASFA